MHKTIPSLSCRPLVELADFDLSQTMVLPFGVGVGDFLAILDLIRKVFLALEETCGAAAQYQAIGVLLGSLEKRLLRLRDFECDDPELSAAVEVSTAAFKDTLERFRLKMQPYSAALSLDSSASNWRKVLRKVRWSMLDKEVVHDFQSQILLHAMNLNLTMQIVHQ